MGFVIILAFAASIASPELEQARDRQDRAALGQITAKLAAAAEKQPNDAQAQYRHALAQSYAAEVALELRDKNAARAAAESGIHAAEKAVALQPSVSEHHRILGALCGQVIPANVWAGLKYGRCALDEINKAIEIDPKSSTAYLSRGVGNYYLPASFGGGTDKALQDIEKAIQINPGFADAYMWQGIALRKLNRNPEARTSFTKSLQLRPNRIWTKQQFEKTPAQ